MLFWKLLNSSFRAQIQYPASFCMMSISYFLSTLLELLSIWALFDRFHVVQGWTFAELSLIYGVVHMGFAVAEGFARGFDTFSQTIKQGDFDRILLRPLSTLFQVAMHEVQFMRVGRFVQGLIVFIWGAKQLHFSLFSLHTFVIILSLLGTSCLFYGLFIIQAAVSFWTIESLEIMNIATYGGVKTCQYPIVLFNKAFRLIFTFIIPLSCVAYYPIATLLRQESIPLLLGTLAPLAGILFLLLACQFWHFGVRHYRSTGS